MAPKAANTVFAIPELLENVLLHLGTIQLFRVRRVNRAFVDMTKASIALRRKMFLSPSSGSVEARGMPHRIAVNTINPLLRQLSDSTDANAESHWCLPVLRRLKSIEFGESLWYSPWDSPSMQCLLRGVIVQEDIDRAFSAYDRNVEGDQSWKSMLITSDNCEVDMKLVVGFGSDFPVYGKIVTFKKVVKMEDVADAIAASLQHMALKGHCVPKRFVWRQGGGRYVPKVKRHWLARLWRKMPWGLRA